MKNKYGVIDIGSNSVRLLISDGVFFVQNKEVITTQLALGLAQTHMLSEVKMEETILAVAALIDKAKKADCNKFFIFATEAVRAAKNGSKFKDNLEKRLNVQLDVINGLMEAQIGFMGANTNPDITATVVDIGGASIEFVLGKGKEIFRKKSVPYGMVVLKDSLNKNQEEIENFFKEKLTDFSENFSSEKLILIGGTPTTIASMALRQNSYDSKEIHNFFVSKSFLYSLMKEIENLTPEEITTVFKTVSLKRAEVIYYGIVAAASILSSLNQSGFFVSELDNLEGYLMYKLQANC